VQKFLKGGGLGHHPEIGLHLRVFNSTIPATEATIHSAGDCTSDSGPLRAGSPSRAVIWTMIATLDCNLADPDAFKDA